MNISSKIFLMQDTPVTPNKKRVLADIGSSCSTCHLRKLCIPRNLNQSEMLQFENMVTGKRRVARNASLYRKHDKLGMLYVVRFGQFKLMGGPLNEQVVGFLMAGDLLGLDAIASEGHNFRPVALENSEVCEIPFAAITGMMSNEHAVQRQFLKSMSEALNNESSRSLLLATRSLDERFAGFLLKLGEKYARLGYSDKSFRLSMSRGDIASYIGTTSESVSRLIARFDVLGAVSISGRLVELLDRPYLQGLVGGDEQTVKRVGLPNAEAKAVKNSSLANKERRVADQLRGLGSQFTNRRSEVQKYPV